MFFQNPPSYAPGYGQQHPHHRPGVPYQQSYNSYGAPGGYSTSYPSYNPVRSSIGPPPGVDIALWQWFQVYGSDLTLNSI